MVNPKSYYLAKNLSHHLSNFPIYLSPRSLRPVSGCQREFQNHRGTFSACWASHGFLRGMLCMKRLDQVRHIHPGRTLAGTGVTCHQNTQLSPRTGTDFAPKKSQTLSSVREWGHVYLAHFHITSFRHSALYRVTRVRNI